MGKRSDFKRIARDFYPTPIGAVEALKPHLKPGGRFVEPCAGQCDLIRHILSISDNSCAGACDLESNHRDVISAVDASEQDFTGVAKNIDYFITNPPWPAIGKHGEPVISIIENLTQYAPVWLLLSSDFKHNKYFDSVGKWCVKCVSVGRVKWIPDSDGPGKDNCAWYLFDRNNQYQMKFFWRQLKRMDGERKDNGTL